jgi:4-amino-4-deoxy-L-arabinose transferase-like glycosyltransferase
MTGPRLARLVAAASVLLVVSFQLWVSANNPPGFLDDEASFALNGYTLAHGLRDQSGARLPVLFPSFGDYKSATFSYVLAPAIAVFGPSVGTARAVAAALGLAAVLLVGLIGYRRAGPWIGLAAAVGAGLTPWLFQLGRLAVDTSMFPFAVALTLLATEVWARRGRRTLARSVWLGGSLALLTYAYGAGRLLGPLFAAALVLFVRRVPWRSLAGAWLAYAVFLVPLVLYRIRHPAGITARFHETSFSTRGMSLPGIVGHASLNYLHDLSPWHWIVSGDRKPYVDVWGAPQLLAVVVVLAAVGVVEIAWHRRRDRYWLYAIAAYLLTAVPASLTVDRHQALRLSAMPVCVAVLSIPGLEAVARLRRPLLFAAAAVLAVGALAEWGFFVARFAADGPGRTQVFEADVPALVQRGLAGGRTIYVDHDDSYALTMGQWYAVSHGLPESRVVRLPDGAVPPTGSMVLGRTESCDYVCDRVAEADTFWLARAAGPKPAG